MVRSLADRTFQLRHQKHGDGRGFYAVLDESTAALDVDSEAAVYAQCEKKGMGFLSVAHRPTVIRYHSKVLLRSEVNIELNFPPKLRGARSRLYRRRFLQVNTRWKALAEIYTMHSFAPFSNLNFFVKNRQNFFAIELMNIH